MLLKKAYSTRLQPELTHQYETVSEQRHQWLQIDELEQKLKTRQSLVKNARRQQPMLEKQSVEQLPEQL